MIPSQYTIIIVLYSNIVRREAGGSIRTRGGESAQKRRAGRAGNDELVAAGGNWMG